jgi:uncharacterized membrane protein
MFREELRTLVEYFVIIVEACGAIVIMMGVSRSIVQYIRSFFGHITLTIRQVRFKLGQSMVMGLEFQVAADILKTSLSPTWNDILLLAALIGLRTLLNYLLERELEMLGHNFPISSMES